MFAGGSSGNPAPIDRNDIRLRHGRKLSRALDVFTVLGILLLFAMFGEAFAGAGMENEAGSRQLAVMGSENEVGNSQYAVMGRDNAVEKSQYAAVGRENEVGNNQYAVMGSENAVGSSQYAAMGRENAVGRWQHAAMGRENAVGCWKYQESDVTVGEDGTCSDKSARHATSAIGDMSLGDRQMMHVGDPVRTEPKSAAYSPIVLSGTVWSAPTNSFPVTDVTVYDNDGMVFLGSTTTTSGSGQYQLTVLPVEVDEKVNGKSEMVVLGNPVMNEACLELTVMNQCDFTINVSDGSGLRFTYPLMSGMHC